jgi:hypothetical protein
MGTSLITKRNKVQLLGHALWGLGDNGQAYLVCNQRVGFDSPRLHFCPRDGNRYTWVAQNHLFEGSNPSGGTMRA